jgi:hypothetical protein
MELLLDYIRMVSYAVVVLTSLRGIAKRKFNGLLFLGDVLMSLAWLVTLSSVNILHRHLETTADIIVTPAAILWAIIHFRAMCVSEDIKLKRK